jgi:predicted amidohydrolase
MLEVVELAPLGKYAVKRFKAAVIQFDIHREDLERNLSAVKRRIAMLSRRGVKLAVLPEMWSVGFANQRLKELSKTTPRVLDELGQLAKESNMVIIGSLPEKQGSKIFNTAYVVDTDGSMRGSYQKVHLFSPTSEHKHFQRGKKAVVVSTHIAPIGLMICYDLRFPELCRSLVLKGASMVAVMAQWPAERVAVWKVLLRARAMENQIFVIGANSCGRDGAMNYGGHSQIISPDGQVLARGGKHPASLQAAINLQIVEQVRKRIPCLKERVPEAYK